MDSPIGLDLKPAKWALENTLQSGRSGDNSRRPGDQIRRLLGGRSGPASPALGPALWLSI